jgi:uncharacterized protein (TIGR04255 family)
MSASGRPGDLPDFENPPVVEVVLSVQFERLAGLRTSHFGVLWGAFRDEYPLTEDQVPIEAVFERFDLVPRTKVGIKIETVEKPPAPRVWFLSKNGARLFQIQADRFIHNWRGEGADYPRYEALLDSFERGFDAFKHFAHSEELGEVVPNQCEVTYVNHFIAGDGWAEHGELSEVLAYCNPAKIHFLGPPEDSMIRLKFQIQEGAGAIGRLHVEVQPVWRVTDHRPMYVMTLTARGAPTGPGLEGVTRFFGIGRRWIVRGFTSLTTTKMHKIWRRKDG